MSGLPPRRRLNANDMDFEGIEPTPDGPPQNVDYWQIATAGYFETMEIPLVAGRAFDERDVAASRRRSSTRPWPKSSGRIRTRSVDGFDPRELTRVVYDRRYREGRQTSRARRRDRNRVLLLLPGARIVRGSRLEA